MKILVCGAGAVGIYLGVLLTSKENEVTLLGKRKLKATPHYIFINHKRMQVPEKVYKMPLKQHFDFIFVTVKLYDLEIILEQLKKNQVTCSILVSIQNGLVDNKKYQKIIGKQRIIVLSVFEGFRLLEDQLLMTPTEMGWKVENTQEGKEVSRLLLDAGILCKPEPELNTYRAEKTIVNCCLNALSAIEKKPFDELFASEHIRKRIDVLFQECYAVLSKEYHLEDPKIIQTRMYRVWSHMNHYSSTYQDVLSGRKTEIDFLNGYIVSQGQKLGIETPENKKVVAEFSKIKTQA